MRLFVPPRNPTAFAHANCLAPISNLILPLQVTETYSRLSHQEDDDRFLDGENCTRCPRTKAFQDMTFPLSHQVQGKGLYPTRIVLITQILKLKARSNQNDQHPLRCLNLRSRNPRSHIHPRHRYGPAQTPNLGDSKSSAGFSQPSRSL